MLTKILSVHFGESELQILDKLAGSHPRATRHLVHLLAVRAGLKQLTANDIEAATKVMNTRIMKPKAGSVSV